MAPTIRNGTSTTLEISTAKLPTASRKPWSREARIGPQPCARNEDSDGLAVIEFHSAMFRIQSATPVDDVGEIEPKTASCRAHHGPMTTMNNANAATPARTEIGG